MKLASAGRAVDTMRTVCCNREDGCVHSTFSPPPSRTDLDQQAGRNKQLASSCYSWITLALALCDTSDTRSGGEHHLNFMVLGMIACEACQCRQVIGRHGESLSSKYK